MGTMFEFVDEPPQDMRRAITNLIRCGGDADTTAAIVGGIVDAGVGPEGIPRQWLDGIWEWPRTVDWMRRLGESLADSQSSGEMARSPRVNPIAVLIRNVFFLGVVLVHGLRRLAPPY